MHESEETGRNEIPIRPNGSMILFRIVELHLKIIFNDKNDSGALAPEALCLQSEVRKQLRFLTFSIRNECMRKSL